MLLPAEEPQLTMLSQPESTMLAEHVEVKSFCPAHDGHREGLQARYSTLLQMPASL